MKSWCSLDHIWQTVNKLPKLTILKPAQLKISMEHRATRDETRVWRLTLHWKRDIKYYQKVFPSLSNCLSALLDFGVGFYYSILEEIGDIFEELWNNFERRWTVLLGKRNSELIYFLWHLPLIASNLVFNQFKGIFRNSWNEKLWVHIWLYFSFYLSFTQRTYFIAKGNC